MAAGNCRHSCRLGAISRAGREKRSRKPDFLGVSASAVAAGPAAHVTPSKSRGPAARTARRALPRRDRRTAIRHGRERPGHRRAAQRLAGHAGPRPGTGFRPGGRACHHGVLPARRASRHPRRRDRGAPARGCRSRTPCPGPFPRPGRLPRGRITPGPGPRPGGAPAGAGPGRRPGPATGGRLPGGGAGRPGHHRARRAGSAACCTRRASGCRPGGALAVITASTPRPGGLRDDPGEVIAAARAAGPSTPSTSSPCTPPSPAASSPPARRTPPARTRPPAPRPSTPASTATCSCSPSPEEPPDD